jgi:hypothetical protein
MERATLENDLSRAEAHVANGQKRIAQQHEIIAELDREGHDTAPAKDMLASFERTQAMHVANRDRIAGKLATLTRLPMASETETLAMHLVRALNDAPDGRPMQWRMIEHLDGVTADVVEFAAARGWVQVEGSHIALTEAGRQLARGPGRI